MKTRFVLVLILIAAVVTPGWAASAQEPGDDSDNALLAMLRYVPDTAQIHQSEIYFGDIAAWHTSWNVPRLPNLVSLDLLPREPHGYWLFIMPRQTVPPETLGAQYILQNDMRPFYGFDLFMVDRFMFAGNPPDDLTVVESSIIEPDIIAERLTEAGYAAETLDDWTRFSLFEDYGYDISNDSIPRVGMIGQLNRIALHDGTLMIARATPNVTAALDAAGGKIDSLADNPLYLAGVATLTAPALDDTGELVGAILTARDLGIEVAMLGEAATPQRIEERRQRMLSEGDVLPPYNLLAFGTRHSADQGATFLILGVVFPPGTDAEGAASVIEKRIRNYVSLRFRRSLDDRWSFDRAFAAEVQGLPVAVIVMRVDDPSIAPEGERANTAVFSWVDLLFSLDLGFLAQGPFEEE